MTDLERTKLKLLSEIDRLSADLVKYVEDNGGAMMVRTILKDVSRLIMTPNIPDNMIIVYKMAFLGLGRVYDELVNKHLEETGIN